MFCQQRKNVNTASSNKGTCRNPITRLWEENSSAAGQKKRGGGMVAVLLIALGVQSNGKGSKYSRSLWL